MSRFFHIFFWDFPIQIVKRKMYSSILCIWHGNTQNVTSSGFAHKQNKATYQLFFSDVCLSFLNITLYMQLFINPLQAIKFHNLISRVEPDSAFALSSLGPVFGSEIPFCAYFCVYFAPAILEIPKIRPHLLPNLNQHLPLNHFITDGDIFRGICLSMIPEYR